MQMLTKLALVFLSCALVNVANAEDWRAFSVQTAPGFSVQLAAEGSVKMDQEQVWFRVDSAKLSRPDAATMETEATAVYVGLAYPLDPPTVDGDTWAIFTHPAPIELSITLSPDGETVLEAFEQNIDIKGKAIPKGTWVFMSVGARTEGQVGYNFAHEPGTPTQ